MARSDSESTPPSERMEELERLQVQNTRLAVVFDTVQDLISTLSVHEVMGRLLTRTLAHLDAEIGSILVAQPDRSLRILMAQGLPEDVVRDTRLRAGEGISGHVVKTAEPLLVPDIESDKRFKRSNRERYYTNSFISAPLQYQGSVQGVINVNNKRTRTPFSPEDLKLLEALAGHAAVALANAHSYEQMLVRAQHDTLTDLANHGHFWSLLDAELNRSERHSRQFALAILDVDEFKTINDRYGHMCGDQILREIATTIRHRCRTSDQAARYGGDEFAVILPETGLEGAVAFSEQIRQCVEAEVETPEDCAPVTISAGVASYPQDAGAAADLVKVADTQLYRAKHEGRNRVCAPQPGK